MNLAHVLAGEKRYQEALDADLRALATVERLDATAGSLEVRMLDYAASLSLKLRRPTDAEQYYRRALPAARRVFGPEDGNVGQLMLRYSAVLHELQRRAESKIMAREGRQLLARNGLKAETVDVLGLAQGR